MGNLVQDGRYGVRMLLRNPGFTAVALIALALGIGANTAIFSVVNAALLRPLPYKDPDSLIVPATVSASGSDRGSVSYADVIDWGKEEQVFASVAAFRQTNADLTGDGDPVRVQAAIVSEDYFRVMGVEPLLGRTFLPEEQQPNGPFAVVLSYGLWQGRFGADPSALDRPLVVNGRPASVVGVMPKDSQWPETVEIWTPLGFGATPPDWVMRRDNQIWQAAARLQPGVTVEQATAVIKSIASRVEQENPATRAGVSGRAVPIHEWIVGPDLRRALLVLLGAVGFVLLISCVNVANLLLARAATREREIAIRTALGAARIRLIRQLLTESLMLSIAGGALGLLLALWGVDVLQAMAPNSIPRLSEAGIDGGVLTFVAATSLLTSLVFGLIPALHASKPDLNESLKEGGRGSTGGARGSRVRNLLVVSEIALSLVLLVGAGLMIRSFFRLQQVDPGFNVNNLLTLDLTAPRLRYPKPPAVADFYQKVIARISALPGVQSVGATSALPLGGGGFYLGRAFLVEGAPPPPDGVEYSGQWNIVTPGYFQALGIPLLKGRDFTDRDTADSTPVIIINETMARAMFGDQDPLGKRIKSWRDENVLREVVGVVQNVRYFGRDDRLQSLAYVPHRQDSRAAMAIAVNSAGDVKGLAAAVRQEIAAVDKDIAVANIKTMERILDESVATRRLNMLLLSIFAAVALILAAVGIYGVLSYSIAQRTHEIGIRMALGARSADVLRLVVGHGLKLVLTGVAIGLGGALALTQ
ncbi:MAG TPA: ABC transporter permease, partial [Blastocatellia bacterium]|nr:ABC transporter permease [Blastocatellia bacterium]